MTRVEVSRWERGHVVPAADVFLRLLAVCGVTGLPLTNLSEDPGLDEADRALVTAQLQRTPEQRLHVVEEFARLRASAGG